MIKLIVFDFSNVCYTDDQALFLEVFSKRHGLGDDFLKRYRELVVQADLADFSGVELWEKLIEEFNLPGEPMEIIKELVSFRKPFEETLEFVKQLRKVCRTAFLTNYNQTYWDEVMKLYPVSPYFDDGVISFTLKARKPDTDGVEVLMDNASVTPQETVVIDDKEEYMVKAKELGVNTIIFKDLNGLKEELKALDVKF
ncbi:MAG: HAD-IA family hydrolase [Candidatus Woesearchaeota archaeon]|jgi:HAD superfamily hydrolase (TIGR01509 family)|nr:HAD-IA family hydrolase [Candidatus Woesearchaeota archaeon]MDP7458146.1 HAD-IA family hydrolase [Candidatus Woesearchaeota archaeon]|tara:strand:- start:318 stop:911 length:594 start_codon:yes stop_codon:yes gene_type:complete